MRPFQHRISQWGYVRTWSSDRNESQMNPRPATVAKQKILNKRVLGRWKEAQRGSIVLGRLVQLPYERDVWSTAG